MFEHETPCKKLWNMRDLTEWKSIRCRLAGCHLGHLVLISSRSAHLLALVQYKIKMSCSFWMRICVFKSKQNPKYSIVWWNLYIFVTFFEEKWYRISGMKYFISQVSLVSKEMTSDLEKNFHENKYIKMQVFK